MKTIGMLGGMSWHSTELYYRLINEGIQQKLGGLHSAKILMASVEFAEMESLQRQNKWDEAASILADLASKLERGGADFILICTNTMHISAPVIEQAINIPLLHIADATAEAIVQQGFKATGLLGTRFTMQMDYYKSRLGNKGLKVLVPDEDGCKRIDEVIFKELCYGVIDDQSKSDYLKIINLLTNNGAKCIIAGCTEITLLIKQADTRTKLFDSTAIHAQAAIEFALNDE